MADGPMSRYRTLVAEGKIEADPAQRAAVEKLQLLHMRLADYVPSVGKKVALGWLGFGRKAAGADKTLRPFADLPRVFPRQPECCSSGTPRCRSQTPEGTRSAATRRHLCRSAGSPYRPEEQADKRRRLCQPMIAEYLHLSACGRGLESVL